MIMKPLNFKQLTQAMCILDDGGHEIPYPRMRKAMSKLSLLIASDPRVMELLLTNGRKTLTKMGVKSTAKSKK